MAEKPVIFIIGADKGGVGKTNVCRALLDYLAARQVTARVFDTEYLKGDLKGFCPDAKVIDLFDVKDQMQIFDEIRADTVRRWLAQVSAEFNRVGVPQIVG